MTKMSSKQPRYRSSSDNGGTRYGSEEPHLGDASDPRQSYRGGRGRGSQGARDQFSDSGTSRDYPRRSSDRGYGESRSYGGGRHGGRGRGGRQGGGEARGQGRASSGDGYSRWRPLSDDGAFYSEPRSHWGGHDRGGDRRHSASGRAPRGRGNWSDAYSRDRGFDGRESRSYSEPRSYGRGRGRGHGRQSGGPRQKCQVCLFHKFTGKCNYGDGCRDRHLRPIAREQRLECYVPIPENLPVSIALGRNWCNPQLVMAAVGCAVMMSERNDRELKIVTDSEKSLQDAKEALELLLVQLYPISPSWCYLHMEGAQEISESVLFFEPYRSHNPGNFYGVNSKTTVYQVSISDRKTSKGSDLRRLSASCSPSPSAQPKPEILHVTLSGIYGATPKHPDRVLRSMKDKINRVRIITDHVKDIHEKLSNALKWLVQDHIPARGQGYTAKLEARFGKVVWSHVPEDFLASEAEGITVENFSELIFEKFHRRIFNTIVLEENVEQLTSVLDTQGTAVETFDFMLTAINQDGDDCRMDARLRILESGEKAVLLVKEDEKKIVKFDIICLHRQHDIRIALNCVNIIPHDRSHRLFRIVQQMVDTVQYSPDQVLSFVPRSSSWAVRFIRHKVRTPYIIDDKYIVTVSSIKEHTTDWMGARKGELLSVKLKDFKKEHSEVEFHNARWVTAFGKNARLSPEESLERMLHMDLSDITPELAGPAPHPWTVESIAEDFEEFLSHSESLNETLGEAIAA